MHSPKTVKVEHPDGYMVINESDFDPKLHKMYDGSKQQKKAPKKSKGVTRGE